jgi:hypothetical protein
MHALRVTDPTVNLINNYGALDQRSTKLRAAETTLQTTVSCFIDAAACRAQPSLWILSRAV